MGESKGKLARLVAVRERQHRVAIAESAHALRALASMRDHGATVAMLTRSMQPEPGPASGIELAARLRFGERMDAAQTSLRAAVEDAECRVEQAQAAMLLADQRREGAERLHASAVELAARVRARRTVESLACAGAPMRNEIW